MELWVDAAAAHARPPGGVPGADPATYGLVGLRLEARSARQREFELALEGGQSADAAGGAWLAGEAGAGFTLPLGPLRGGARIGAFGLGYREPFDYAAYGLSLRPELVRSRGALSVSARGELTRGRWRTVVERESGLPTPPPFALSDSIATGPLALTGGALAVARGLGPGWLQLGAEAYRSRSDGPYDGWYHGASAALAAAVGRAQATLQLRWWRSPAGAELGYSAAVALALAPGLELRLSGGRAVRDPLYGTAGTVATSVGLSWRPGSGAAARARIVEIGERTTGGGRRVRFRLRAPSAREVALSGDFTGWAPRPLRREGDHWVLELVLAPGLYHFGFLVDGRWTVPPDAPGIVDDGWGQKNASIVIET